MDSPLFNQNFSFREREKHLPIQQPVTQLTVEAFVVTILPGTARLDKQGCNLQLGKPFPDKLCRELAALLLAQWS
jgi:hypothetical protein